MSSRQGVPPAGNTGGGDAASSSSERQGRDANRDDARTTHASAAAASSSSSSTAAPPPPPPPAAAVSAEANHATNTSAAAARHAANEQARLLRRARRHGRRTVLRQTQALRRMQRRLQRAVDGRRHGGPEGATVGTLVAVRPVVGGARGRGGGLQRETAAAAEAAARQVAAVLLATGDRGGGGGVIGRPRPGGGRDALEAAFLDRRAALAGSVAAGGGGRTHDGGGSGNAPPRAAPLNDEGSLVSPGALEPHHYYCGRFIGRDALPGSDGRCGPENGPPCASCRRYGQGRRLDELSNRFPTLDPTALAVALRVRGGAPDGAASLLETLGATPVPDRRSIEALSRRYGLPRIMAEAALKRNGADVTRAEEWLSGGGGRGRNAAAMELEPAARARALFDDDDDDDMYNTTAENEGDARDRSGDAGGGSPERALEACFRDAAKILRRRRSEKKKKRRLEPKTKHKTKKDRRSGGAATAEAAPPQAVKAKEDDDGGDTDSDDNAADDSKKAATPKRDEEDETGDSDDEDDDGKDLTKGAPSDNTDTNDVPQALRSFVERMGAFPPLVAPPSSSTAEDGRKERHDSVSTKPSGTAAASNDGEGQNADRPIIVKGHRMVLVNPVAASSSSFSSTAAASSNGDDVGASSIAPPSPPVQCTLCASVVPGPASGSHRCTMCGLCEGCVQQLPPVALPSTEGKKCDASADGKKTAKAKESKTGGVGTTSSSSSSSSNASAEAAVFVARARRSFPPRPFSLGEIMEDVLMEQDVLGRSDDDDDEPSDAANADASKVGTPSAPHRCPGLANGGHLHHHPLSFTLDRRGVARCDVEGPGCERRSVTWSCASCRFDVCRVCIGKQAPEGYCRLLGRKITKGAGESAASAGPSAARLSAGSAGAAARGLYARLWVPPPPPGPPGAIPGENLPPPPTRTSRRSGTDRAAAFDREAARKDCSDRWRHGAREGWSRAGLSQCRVIVGTGGVGTTAPPRASVLGTAGRSTTTTGSSRGAAVSPAKRELLPKTTRLPDEARRALERFSQRSHGVAEGGNHALVKASSSYSASSASLTSSPAANEEDKALSLAEVVTAVDITHAEDLLQRAQSLNDKHLLRKLYEAVAGGSLDVAGTLLLSRAYAPVAPSRKDATGSTSDGGSAAAAAVVANTTSTTTSSNASSMSPSQQWRCWCGDIIDAETSPDGAVGCLGGHAMHPSCAADLLLGGGSCPTCRQPVFFARLSHTEARAALDYTLEEERRKRKEERDKLKKELEDGSEPIPIQVGDIVRIESNVERCREVQGEDPISGGWIENDMKEACGTEGRVLDVVVGKHGSPVALRVRSKARRSSDKQHSFICFRYQHRCEGCQMYGPSPETGNFKCIYCGLCERCCGRTGNTSCAKVTLEWTWAPSLLRLLCRAGSGLALGVEDADDEDGNKMVAATKAVEHHMSHLRAELMAVKAAREAVKVEMEAGLALKPDPSTTELSVGSISALSDLAKVVSPPDCQRARHLLLLAEEWGLSKGAKAYKESLYDDIRAGHLDSVARKIRRFNASRRADAARWADALAETGQYTVRPSAKVDLRAFPGHGAPKTGFSLDPGSRFWSLSEDMDNEGNVWLRVDGTKAAGERIGKVVVDNISPEKLRTLIGARVRRGEHWRFGDRDGGEGNEGVIIECNQAHGVVVKWDGIDRLSCHRASAGRHELAFANSSLPPPQGWLCIRPCGVGSPSIVVREKGSLRCSCCGDGLCLPCRGCDGFIPVKGSDLRKGDRLLVAATLEPVDVHFVQEDRIYCSYPLIAAGTSPAATSRKHGSPARKRSRIEPIHETRSVTKKLTALKKKPDNVGVDKIDKCVTGRAEEFALSHGHTTIWYRPQDLVFPSKAKAESEDEETRVVDGYSRTRRETVMIHGGDDVAAKKAWKLAGEMQNAHNDGDGFEVGREGQEIERFASCLRGHLLHARCFQGALLAGGCCPAPNCTEPLWVPNVRNLRNGVDEGNNDCCSEQGEQGATGQAEALRTASELSSHASQIASREGSRTSEQDTLAGQRQLKMCPACCAGPLCNENCSDMRSHHGECVTMALPRRYHSVGEIPSPCTPQGKFRASEKEIAESLTKLSATKSVADVLPKCPTHNVVVMFNGCMACGHLFTGMRWTEMPAWDPDAKAKLELDKKKMNAARLLSEQIRKEAALLQFERDALTAM